MIPALSFLRMGGARIENAIRSAITAGGGLDLRLPVGSAQNHQFLGSRTPKALIGATERAGSVGRTVLWNLLSSPFGGQRGLLRLRFAGRVLKCRDCRNLLHKRIVII